MIDFYRCRFRLSANPGITSINLDDLISAIKAWLENKYGSQTITSIIQNWSKFSEGGTFGDSPQIGKVWAETISNTVGTEFSWACRIIEIPKHNSGYIPRQWTTEIGFQSTTPSQAEISYLVQYEDLPSHHGRVLSSPRHNIPTVARNILTDTKWECTMLGRPLEPNTSIVYDRWMQRINGQMVNADVTYYLSSEKNIFGIEECRALFEASKKVKSNTGETIMSAQDFYRNQSGEVSFTSLCYITEGNDGKGWLNRLADLKDNILHIPFKSGRLDNFFENRDRIYRNDGPSDVGYIGFWEWSAIPNRNNPATDYIQSHFVNGKTAIRVQITSSSSFEDLTSQLKAGSITSSGYICDTLFCYRDKDKYLTGILCKSNEFSIVNSKVKLSSNVYMLPYYSISMDDIFFCEDRSLSFLKSSHLSEDYDFVAYFAIRDTSEIIRQIILDRATWPLFKNSIGATKADWRTSKALLEKVCSNSLYDEVSLKAYCTTSEAKKAVDEFVSRANELLAADDIDAETLAAIILNHEGLMHRCEEIAADKWKQSHAEDISAAKADVEKIYQQAEQAALEAKKKVADAEANVTATQQRHADLLADISSAQRRLDQIRTEINRYDELGKNTVEAVRSKIAAAQADMASFIADLSVFLPQNNATAQSAPNPPWQYTITTVPYPDYEIELANGWADEYNSISQNLSSGLYVETDLSGMFAAFLYAAHINHVPLLIAGPNGSDIADMLSVSLYARGAGHLTISQGFSNEALSELSNLDDAILSVSNMFDKSWNDNLPQTIGKLNKQILWTHPYVEDLLVEPKGLYNYMLPVFSECFISEISPDFNPWPGKRSKNFKAYETFRRQPLRISAFKRLGLSKLILNQLTSLLTDTKAILNTPSKDKDVEILFGLLPLCVLTGRTDILKEVTESEAGISGNVKAEVSRYIEEE